MNAAKRHYQVTQAKAVAAKLHLELVRAGKFYQAKRVLFLLNSRSVVLHNGDSDYELSCRFEDLGFAETQSRSGNSGTYYLRIKGE